MQINTYADVVQFVRNNSVFKKHIRGEGETHTHCGWAIIDFVLADAELCCICAYECAARSDCNDEGTVDEIVWMLLEDATD
jgi:hypothetical protein